MMEPIKWLGNKLVLLDQRLLPNIVDHVVCSTSMEVGQAIRDMVVRGAPAIGVSAAYGLVLAAQESEEQSLDAQRAYISAQAEVLKETRPTAVNLGWALDSMLLALQEVSGGFKVALESVAVSIQTKDLEANYKMGAAGADLISPGSSLLTHCNAGALATTGYGTALGVIRSGFDKGSLQKVFATETRPWFQGSRLTTTELHDDGIDVTLIADSAVGFLLQSGAVDWVVVGADRIAANGDVANKIGTYSIAVLARYHKVKFMVVAPTSTIDINAAHGGEIPIEYRSAEEITRIDDRWLALPETRALNPVFDVTPVGLIDVLVTEKEVILAPAEEKIRSLIQG